MSRSSYFLPSLDRSLACHLEHCHFAFACGEISPGGYTRRPSVATSHPHTAPSHETHSTVISGFQLYTPLSQPTMDDTAATDTAATPGHSLSQSVSFIPVPVKRSSVQSVRSSTGPGSPVMRGHRRRTSAMSARSHTSGDEGEKNTHFKAKAELTTQQGAYALPSVWLLDTATDECRTASRTLARRSSIMGHLPISTLTRTGPPNLMTWNEVST